MISDSKKFEIDTINKKITIISLIGSIDFYKECMHIFSRSEFMDVEMPIDEIKYAIYVINDWEIINKELIYDQSVIIEMK